MTRLDDVILGDVLFSDFGDVLVSDVADVPFSDVGDVLMSDVGVERHVLCSTEADGTGYV